MEEMFVQELVVVLIAGLIGAFIALRMKQTIHIGYLLGGVLLTLPFLSGLVDFDISRNLAQLGVALVLFTTGVEFPISKILSIRKSIIVGAFLHAVLFIFGATILLKLFNLSTFQALFLSAAFSNSATVLVLKIIEEVKFDIKVTDTIISWLVLQDIAMVLVAVFINSYSSGEGLQLSNIFGAALKSGLFIGISLLLGRSVVPKIFESASKTSASELLLILAFVFCLTVAFFAEMIGLSYTLGAFLAGVMISESFVNHEIFSEVKPIRDVFSALFYVTLGTLISLSFLLSDFVTIVLILFILILWKFITGFVITTLLEKQTRTGFLVSMSLVQGGEFAFILAQIGLNNDWIDRDFYSMVIIVNVISLFVTPLLIRKSEKWYMSIREFVRRKHMRLYRLLFVKLDRIVDVDQPDLINHVVICGFGRVGTYVGRALDKTNIDFVVVDSSAETVDYCKQRGIRIVFGDASNIDVLEKADVERAQAIVIALPEEGATEIIASNARDLNPNIKVLARSHMPEEDGRLKSKGVTITVEPEFEAAISISKKILNFYGRRDLNIGSYLKKSRRRQRSKISNGDNNVNSLGIAKK
ncbi:MAG: cation:proton antiporter [Candidatus Dojkabacteria bacterium]|nr:cation:proton antiporter [Candidatus Dojkabacteria bacterium]